MSKRSPDLLIQDIIESAQKILDYAKGLTYDEFKGDSMRVDSAFLKLSNNLYLSEKNFGPVGLTDINLTILNEEQFNSEKQRLQSFDVVVNKFKY